MTSGLPSLLLALAAQAGEMPPAERVELVAVPWNGIQPRAAVDARGTVHLVAFRGDPAAGSLAYASAPDGRAFGEPLAVGLEASAVALGNVRGAQLALGRGGSVHVVWNGAARASSGGTPFLYARLEPGGAAFEPARDLAGAHRELDGGGAVAADERGNVWAVWHAGGAEAARRVFVAHSSDDGRTFEAPRVVGAAETGVCPCCGLAAAVDDGLAILYRGAREGRHRDTLLLASAPDGAFRTTRVDPWTVPACVLSTFALARGPRGLAAAFESEGEVRFAWLGAEAPEARAVSPSERNQKHPSLACAADGTTLVAWIEGMAWGKEGTLAYRMLATDVERAGIGPKVPAWSLVQAVALADGRFLVYH